MAARAWRRESAAIVTVLKDQLQNILPKLIGADGNFETKIYNNFLIDG